jgi:2-methylcitrate dehydratase PrpD
LLRPALPALERSETGFQADERPDVAMTGESKQLHRFVADVDLDRLPATVIARAKRHILETVILALAGGSEEGVAEIRALAKVEYAQGPSAVWGAGDRLQPSGAALVNSYAAAALDYDTLCNTVHGDVVIIPAVLAMAEARQATGRQLLEAYIAGIEVTARLSFSAQPPQRGWTHTSVFGVFGAAAAVARLIGLPETRIGHATGIALSLAAGSQQSNVEKVLTKRLQPALAARNGVFAALAAEAGISGPQQSLEGRCGLWSLYQAGDPALLLKDLGGEFRFLETILKGYPVCSCSHAAIVACLELIAINALDPADISEVEVTVTPFMVHMVGGDFDPSRDPVVAAQFSIRYALVCCILRGGVSLADLDLAAICDPAIQEWAARIQITVDPENDGELAPARVRLKTRSKGVLERCVSVMPGSVEAPLSDAAFKGKLQDCVDRIPGFSEQGGLVRLEEIVEAIDRSDQCTDLTGFLAAVGQSSNDFDQRP